MNCATYIGELPAQPWQPLSPLLAVFVFPGSVMLPTKSKLISQIVSRHPTSCVTDHGGGKQDDEMAIQLEAATLPVSVFHFTLHLSSRCSL